MATEPTVTVDSESLDSRRSGEDRRSEMDRRRASKGLFELRARRDGLASDRRQTSRRGENEGENEGVKVRWYAFWRRTDSQ